MKAVIIGGGIGGLAAGLALRRIGWEAVVLERAIHLSEVGAGVQISPNGVRALEWLGVIDRLRDALFEPEAISLRIGRTGRTVFRLPMKGYAQNRWGAPFYQVHRADLHTALADALRDAGGLIRTGSEVTGYVREHNGASAYIADRDQRNFGDILIGADGIKSVIRAQMLGADRARFTGNTAWRILAPLDALDRPPPPEGVIWAGRGRHAVTTRIKGGTVVNFVGIVEQSDWREEGWTIPGEQAQALQDFAGWRPELLEIIRSDPAPSRWALFDRPPLATWLDGPVALLGDAAHPMLPSMAQGAVQALEDAVVLARCLEDMAPDQALKAYFETRKPRVTQIQARSRDNLEMFHKSGLSKLFTYAPIWAAARLVPDMIHKQQDWIYGADVTAAAAR